MLEIPEQHWQAWLDDARRAVVDAAERLVYARRYGWDTNEEHERLQDAVDAYGVLKHDYLNDAVPCATEGNAEQPNSTTTPARPGPSPSPVRRPSEGHLSAMPT